MTPREAEELAAKLLEGWLVNDLYLQHQDIDVGTKVLPYTGVSGCAYVSVKCQVMAAQTGNLSLELTQTNTRSVGPGSGMTILGNFLKCRADYIAFVVPRDGAASVYVISHDRLLDWCCNNPMRKVKLNDGLAIKNRAEGRQYDSSESLLIAIVDAEPLCTRVFHGR